MGKIMMRRLAANPPFPVPVASKEIEGTVMLRCETPRAGTFTIRKISKQSQPNISEDSIRKDAETFELKHVQGKSYYAIAKRQQPDQGSHDADMIHKVSERLRGRCERFIQALMFAHQKHSKSPKIGRDELNALRDKAIRNTVRNLAMTPRKYKTTYHQILPVDALDELGNALRRRYDKI